MKIVRLKFITPLHVSNVRSDYGKSETVIHSDTLYSAIIEAWNVLGLNNLLNQIKPGNKLPFTVSSLFPYTIQNNSNNFVYFLPRPASFNPFVDIEIQKKVKKIKFIDSDTFKELQTTGEIKIDENNIKGQFYTASNIDQDLFVTSEVPRVKVPRSAQGDAQPFYIERIYFNENSGLYFFLETENNSIYESIKIALDFLANEGIGTDRNVGNGKFTYEIDDNANIIHFNLNNTSSDTTNCYSTNLSLFIPNSHDEFKNSIDDNCYFNFITRGGWITSYPYHTLRKKYVRAIVEGSVLKINAGISGKIVDVTPDKNLLPPQAKSIHTILRAGQSFWVPLKINSYDY